MRVVRDPRCPAHPDYFLYIECQLGDGPVLWACAVCGRPLGVASITGANFRLLRRAPRRVSWSHIEERVRDRGTYWLSERADHAHREDRAAVDAQLRAIDADPERLAP
jgi:hypothetical protein